MDLLCIWFRNYSVTNDLGDAFRFMHATRRYSLYQFACFSFCKYTGDESAGPDEGDHLGEEKIEIEDKLHLHKQGMPVIFSVGVGSVCYSFDAY